MINAGQILFDACTSSFGNEGSKGMRIDASCQIKSKDSTNTLNNKQQTCYKGEQVNTKQYTAQAEFMHTFSLVLYNCLTAATRSAEGFESSVNVCSVFKMRKQEISLWKLFVLHPKLNQLLEVL